MCPCLYKLYAALKKKKKYVYVIQDFVKKEIKTTFNDFFKPQQSLI